MHAQHETLYINFDSLGFVLSWDKQHPGALVMPVQFGKCIELLVDSTLCQADCDYKREAVYQGQDWGDDGCRQFQQSAGG